MRHRSIKEVSANTSGQVREVEETKESTVVTRHGQPVAILVPYTAAMLGFVAIAETEVGDGSPRGEE